ncbi:pilus assembly protein PilM [candidate division KSB1 bacterium]|nr:pilus assembly protein PilM [candidate division KSB1 bacterium]
MTDTNVDTLVGIVLKNENMKIVEIESSGGDQFRINKITEEKLDIPFVAETIKDGSYVSDFADKIANVLDKHGFSTEHAILTVPNDMLVIKKYPYDNDFSDEEIIDQVDWEVKQFSYSPDDEYVIDFGKLTHSRATEHNELVVVAVRKAVVGFIKEVFTRANVKLRVVDAEVFAAIRAINKNYEARDGDVTALINIEQQGIQFIIIDSGEFFTSYQIPLQFKPDDPENSKTETIIKMTSKELKRIIIDHKLGEKIEDLSRIFLFGDLVLDPVLETLQNSYNVRIDRANPFRRLRFAPNVSVDEYIWSRPETFTICVGCALR